MKITAHWHRQRKKKKKCERVLLFLVCCASRVFVFEMDSQRVVWHFAVCSSAVLHSFPLLLVSAVLISIFAATPTTPPKPKSSATIRLEFFVRVD